MGISQKSFVRAIVKFCLEIYRSHTKSGLYISVISERGNHAIMQSQRSCKIWEEFKVLLYQSDLVLVDLLLTPENPSPKNLKEAREVIENLQLAELDNFFQDACLEAQPQSIDQIDPNAVVIYGILLENSLEIIASLPNTQLFHYRTPISKTELTDTLNQLQFSQQKPYAYQEIQQLSGQIYRWLLEPLETQLKGDET